MPCRCDGFEVTADDVRRESAVRLKDLEGQLCNARSLIHKLIKYMGDGTPLTEVPADLRERARAHIEALVAHKRAEHEEDAGHLRAEVERARQIVERHAKDAHEANERANEARTKLAELFKRTDRARDVTDAELLG